MKKVYSGVDIFKLLAAIGVVAIHTNVFFFKTLGRLGVPFFAIISSFFFFKHYFKLLNIQERKKYIFKFVKRMGFLILSWQVLYIPLALVYFRRIVIIGNINIFKYIYYFIYPGYSNANGWGQSWFLIGMLIGLPFVLLIYNFFKNYILIFILGFLLEIYYILANEFQFLTHLPVWGTLYFPRLIIYILIGLIIAKNLTQLKYINFSSLTFFLICMISIFLLENYLIKLVGGLSNSEEIISTVPTSTVLVLFALKYNPTIKSGTLVIRNLSTFLYCIQNYPLQIFLKFFNLSSFLTTELLYFISVLLFSFITFCLYLILKKYLGWKFLYYLT